MKLSHRAVFVFQSLIGLIALACYSFVPGEFNRSSLCGILILSFVSLVMFACARDQVLPVKKSALRPSVLFLIGFYIVHFQLYLDVLFGQLSPDDPTWMIDSDLILKSANISLIGLASFFAGYFIKPGKLYFSRKQISTYPLNYLIHLSAIFFVAFLLGTDWKYFSDALYGQEGSAGTMFSYLVRLFECSLYAIPILHCRNIQAQRVHVSLGVFIKELGYYNLILLAYLILILVAGDRGQVIYFGVFYFASYLVASNKRISARQLALMLIIGSTGAAILGLSKSYRIKTSMMDRFRLALSEESIERLNSISPFTQELAGSVRTLHKVVEFVPSVFGYVGGRLQIQQVLSIIPTGSRWLVLAGVVPNEFRFAGSAAYATWLLEGDNPTSGAGSTCIVDFYLDFGVPLVVAGMFVFGFWVRRFDVNMYGSTIPLWLSVSILVYLSRMIYVSRSTVLFQLKLVAWVFALLFVYQRFISGYRMRNRRDG